MRQGLAVENSLALSSPPFYFRIPNAVITGAYKTQADQIIWGFE